MLLVASLSIGGASAEPGGCLKYGAAGAVGGHLVHHGVLGAAGGCVTGMVVRHRYRKHLRQDAEAYRAEQASGGTQPAQPVPAPAQGPNGTSGPNQF